MSRAAALLLLPLLASLGATGPAHADEAPLTLARVLAEVVRHHPKLQGAALEVEIAEAKALEKAGAFDPSLSMETLTQRYPGTTPPGKAKEQTLHDLGVGLLTREGLKLSGGWRDRQGDVKSPLSATGDGGELFLEFKLPLLRGSGVNPKAAAEDRATLGIELAQAGLRVARLDLLLRAAEAYWGWVASLRRLELIERNLKLARERAEQIERRVSAGDLPRVDGLEAQGEVQRRLEARAKADLEIQKAALKLALYLWGAGSEEGGIAQARPASLPQPAQASEIPLPEPGGLEEAELARAELQALARRPELTGIEFERRIVAVDRELATNDRKPILDLTLSPGYDTGFHAVGFTYKAGLELTIPLATRDADGRLQQARLKDSKLTLARALEVRRILVEVQATAAALNALKIRHAAASEALALATRLEQAERLRFELGEGTLFLVNQRERATLEAALKLVDLRAEEALLRADLAAAQGALGEDLAR